MQKETAQTQDLIILLITHSPTLNRYEIISIKQCLSIYSNRDIRFVIPESLDTSFYTKVFGKHIQFYRVKDKWLKNYRNFNLLKINLGFYKAFSHCKFILYYEPDAFVFYDDLNNWMQKNYSMVGAPWFKGYVEADVDSPFVGVGNGGFSLRKVSDHIKVLNTFGIVESQKAIWQPYKESNIKGKAYHLFFNIYYTLFANNFHHLLNRYRAAEDFFWAEASNKFDWFRVPSQHEALSFSIEHLPKINYKRNNSCLPSGTHAWYKHGYLEFWREFIEPMGYDL